jgi:uncharacterized membrane protein (UPF0127 family)
MSSRTLKENAKKIRSARKRYLLIPAIIFTAILAVLLFQAYSSGPQGRNVSDQAIDLQGAAIPCAIKAPECINFELASDNRSRLRGLSDRDNLPKDRGLLFIFDKQEEQCIWMKDMRFPIDILWLDDNKKILKIEPNVSPDTYPKAYCADHTKYVIELNADTAKNAGLETGRTLNF